MRNVYEILVGRLEGKIPIGRPRRRFEDNITIDLRVVVWHIVDRIHLIDNGDGCQILVKTVINLQFP
jgi:hypothetical protein